MQLRPLFRLSEGLHDFQYIGFANSPQEFRLPAGYLGGLLFARAHKELVPFVKIFAWGDGEQTALYARFGDLCFMLDRSRIHFYAARDGEAGRAELADSPLVQVMFEAIAAAPAQGSLPRLAFLELLRFGPEALRRIALDATNRADHAFTERVRDRCDAARAAVTALAGNGAELGNIVSAIGGEVEAQQELGLALATCAAEIGEVVSQLNFNLAAADTGRAGGGGPWLKIFTSLIKNDPWGFALASAINADLPRALEAMQEEVAARARREIDEASGGALPGGASSSSGGGAIAARPAAPDAAEAADELRAEVAAARAALRQLRQKPAP